MSGAEEPLLVSEQGISKDRRRFIIVTVFDFSLVALLWLLCTVGLGDSSLQGIAISGDERRRLADDLQTRGQHLRPDLLPHLTLRRGREQLS